MKVKVYEGDKIGGCVTEILSEKTKIIFDYGLNLDDTPQIEIEGLTYGKPTYDAVFISHYHGDHIGNIAKILPEIPIYIEEASYQIFKIIHDFGYNKIELDKLNIKTFRIGDKIVAGSMTVTSFIVDHSAYNACMFLVTDGKEKALYTGDYRDNGRKGKLLIKTVKDLSPVDYLITEATTKGNNTHSQKREADLQDEFEEVMGKYDQVFIMMSTANIDRIPVLYKAAKKTSHTFIQDLYMAHITTVIANKIPNPKTFKDVYVYKPMGFARKGDDFKTQYYESFKDKNNSSMLFQPFVMNVRQGMISDLEMLKRKGALKNACLVYSMWSGYKEKEKMAKFLEQVKALGIDLVENDIHAGGHATEEVVDAVIKASGVKKENLYMIHTKGTKEMSKNRLGIHNEVYKKNITAIDTIINKAINGKGLCYFCRDKRYTLYYHGRELLTVREEEDKSITIKLRSEFSGESKLALRLNKDYSDGLEGIMSCFNKDYFRYKNSKSNKWIKLKVHKFSYDKLFEKILSLLRGLLDDYYKDKSVGELQIQGEYCALYKNLDNLDNCGGLWIFDSEYNDIKETGLTSEEKEPSEIINGRFDMIALKRADNPDNSEKPYELIFIELKCKRQAIRQEKSGLLNHIDDMYKFFYNYERSDTNAKQNIKDQVENCIKKFYYLGKRVGSKEEAIDKLECEAEDKYFDKINFDTPHYWVLFDMQYEPDRKKKETIKTLDDIDKMSLRNKNVVKESLKNYQEKLDSINAKFFVGDISKKHLKEIFWTEI